MKIERAVKIKSETLTRVRDNFNACVCCKATQHELIKRAYEPINSAAAKGLPRWAVSYLRGRFEEMLESLRFSDKQVSGSKIDGIFYSVDSSRPDYYGRHGYDAAGFYFAKKDKDGSGIFWDTPNKEPFFITE